ncbi:MAG: 50S ribosomal protein L37ae, partial [Thermoplasmata archaeon]|nr:50S ribosomal protein L37ae [Thermoplasmata archaeon]
MARRTKKVGITGKFGPRYGVTVRKRIKDVSRHRQKAQKCPECQHSAVRRESTGIWKCRHCGLVFAAAAYSTRIREFKK